MKTFKLLSRLMSVFVVVMLTGISGWADEIQTDNFSTNLESWTGNISRVDFSGSQRMRIARDGTASKTFAFTSPDYAYANVTLSFNLLLDDGWETDDDVYVYANGIEIAHYNHTDGSYNKTLSTTTNASGQLLLQIITDTSSDSEYAYIDNISITAIGPVAQTPPIMGNVPNQTTAIGVAYTLNTASYVTLTNGDPILEYNLTGTLPAGLSFNAATGVISGTPTTVAAAVTLSVTATDNDGVSNADSFTITINPPNADLSITKTAPASVTTNNTIQYILSVTNNGPSDTDNLVITDVLPVNVTYQITSGNDWICDYNLTSRTLSCVHPTILASGATSAMNLVVIAPSVATTVSNTVSVSGPLPDYNSANNTSTASTTITASSYASANLRPFTLFRQYNMNGDIKIIGNSVMIESDGTCAPNTTNNNDLNTIYADKDTDAASTLNSTSANLVLPPKVRSADIQFAMLYWQGRTTGTTQIVNGRTVKIKPFGLPNYQTLTTSDAKFNWTGNDYQGAVEVTNLIKASLDFVGDATLDSTGYDKPLWVADVFANKLGDDSNGFGAWSLVIVYKDNAAKLRNISTYDGYDVVYNNTKSATLSGFLTPASGTVDSKFLIFAGEGDISLTDSVTLTNASGTPVSLGSNIFKSSEDIDGVNVANRNPACQNTIGADIRTFSVGNTAPIPIIGHSQTTTTIAMTSTGDQYLPGVFAFSTELYAPDVCYLEDVTFNGLPITTTNLPETDDNVEFEVTITNKDNEAAKGVFIEKVFDRPNEITYVPGSMQIAPIPGTTYSAKTDAIGDDTAEFGTDTNTTKYLLGAGAAWYEGGTIVKDAITKFKYQAKIGDQNASENTYLVSYRNDLLHITFRGLPIRKCVDFNNSFGVYIPILGKYNTVRANAVDRVNGPDPIDPLDVKNALYTQIVNKPFNVDVISFGNDNITPANYTGDLNLSIVELPDSGVCDDVNTSLAISPVYPLTFNAEKYKEVAVTATKATRNAVFKMVTSTTSLCSRDRFAIRPASYSMDANETKLIGNRMYQFTFTASHDGLPGTPSANYDQEVYNGLDKNGTTQLVLPAGCALAAPAEIINNPLPFSGGGVTALVLYPDIGDVNFTVSDQQWTAYSQDQDKGDCLLNSAANTPDGDGKVGCMAQGSKVFTFVPEKFTSLFNLANGSANGSYTYVSNEQNMSASLLLTTTANLDGGGAAANYTAGCFAKDINTTLSLINNKALTWSDSQNRINYFDDYNVTSQRLSQVGPVATFRSGEGNFTNGSASITFMFNFDRNQTIPDNSFRIARNDFNITSVIDQNGTSGSDFIRTNDLNATFVYGRVIPRDIRVFGAVPYRANGWYEVYNTSTINGVGLIASRNEAMWYVNSQHTDPDDGDANVTRINSGTANVGGAVVNGEETYNFPAIAAGSIPYSAKAHIDTDPWLWYGANALLYSDPSAVNLDCTTHPCFNINVVPAIGATGSAKSETEGSKSNKKSDKDTTGWHSTTDYAPAIR